MRSKLVIVAVVLTIATLLLGAGTASAATEVGDTCGATGGVEGDTLVQLSKNPATPPAMSAGSSGVITSWKVAVALPLEGKTYSSQLKIMRPAGGATTFTVVGQSGPVIVGQGLNTFPARISIQAGDRLGFGGGPGFIQWYCETGDPLDELGYIEVDVPLGATQTFPEKAPEIQESVSAVIEPDADNDGYGDETQDACPQSATTQAACPMAKLSTSATATKKLVTVLLTSTVPANVTVKGKASLGKGKKASLKGGTKAVTPGAFTKFRLKFPSKLIKRLKELPPSKKLTLTVTSTAPNLAGPLTKEAIRVKLKGQAKPKARHQTKG